MSSILKKSIYYICLSAASGIHDLVSHASGDMTLNNYRICYFEAHN